MLETSPMGYLFPAPDKVQNHICVLPCGGSLEQDQLAWGTADLAPAVSYIVNGQGIDRMFGGFIFNGISVRSGRYMHPLQAGFGQPADKQDWELWLESLFAPGQNIQALAALAERNPLDVWVSLPYPYWNQQDFGSVAGKPLDFSNPEDRTQAVSWWIDQFMVRWAKETTMVPKVKLRGFLWLRESIPDYDEEVVMATNSKIQGLGLYSMWLPFYGSFGCMKAEQFGFDVVAVHPNYYGKIGYESNWLNIAARYAYKKHTGLQIIFGKGAMYSESHFLDYLNFGLHNRYMKEALLVYRFPQQTIREIHSQRFVDYIRLYTYIKGLYQKVSYPGITY